MELQGPQYARSKFCILANHQDRLHYDHYITTYWLSPDNICIILNIQNYCLVSEYLQNISKVAISNMLTNILAPMSMQDMRWALYESCITIIILGKTRI